MSNLLSIASCARRPGRQGAMALKRVSTASSSGFGVK